MMKLLIIVVVVLGVVAVAQLARVYEQTKVLRKNREEEISFADNKFNAFLWLVWMIVFFGFSAYLMIKYGKTLPKSASLHGEQLDLLLDVNMVIVIAVFFIVNFMLFYFAYKYYYREDRKAVFLAHDNKLELIWTIVPSIVLAFIIIYGLQTWNEVTGQPEGDYMAGDYLKVELTSEQFQWSVRYPGEDKILGAVNVNAINESAGNYLGIITHDGRDEHLESIDARIEKLEKELQDNLGAWPESKVEAHLDKIKRTKRHKQRLNGLRPYEDHGVDAWAAGADDIILTNKPMHLPVDTLIEFNFRSKDVIHSAYMPHFRAQMNTVPGVPTRFKMRTTITTAEMRDMLDDPEFNYILLCNKICGASHYNMWIPIIVETREEYDAWMAQQTTFIAPPAEETAEVPTAEAVIPVEVEAAETAAPASEENAGH